MVTYNLPILRGKKKNSIYRTKYNDCSCFIFIELIVGKDSIINVQFSRYFGI